MEPIKRRTFPEDAKLLYYDPVNWKPSFQELYNRRSENITITLKNRQSGEMEIIEFQIVGATESPVTTVKWIWGSINLDDNQDEFHITFDYYDGLLQNIVVAPSPKSAPVEITAKRTKKIRYPAEITAFDIFNQKDE